METDCIKEAIMWLPGQNKTANSSGSGRSIIWTIVTVLIIAGLALFVFMAVRDLIIYGLYFHYVDELAEKTGLNKYLINALAAVCLAPFFLGIKYYFFSFSRRKHMQGAALLLGMIALYNTALYVATKDDVMGKFYAITTTGVRFSDRALGDGNEWQKVNHDNVWYVTHLAVGNKVDVAGHDWFDQKSGLPLLWYAKLENQIQFYDGPGFDRFTGEPLKAVTKELYFEWQQSRQPHAPAPPPPPRQVTEVPNPTVRNPEIKERDTEAIPPAAVTRPEPKPIETEHEKRLRNFELLLNAGVQVVQGRRNISILISANGPPVVSSPEQVLYARLSSVDQPHFITDVFLQRASGARYFNDLYAGDRDLLKILTAKTQVSAIVVGSLNYVFRKSSSVPNDFVCEVVFNFKVIGPTANMMESETIHAMDTSFSEANAFRGAIDAIVSKLSERFALGKAS
jgi:hypothetical protein